MERDRFLLVVSDVDPVASAVLPYLAAGESTGAFVDGAPIRRIAPGVLLLRRPVLHIHDEHLDRRLPSHLRDSNLPLVFPSVHRSERGIPCYTAHSLGNLAGAAEAGGESGKIVPAAPRLVTAALRRLSELGEGIELPATFESTHHGPALDAPAFFVEITTAEGAGPSEAAVRRMAEMLLGLEEDPHDRIAMGAGGGHYAPHFTDLAIERSWAFGHIASRHALHEAAPGALEAAFRLTPGAEGILFHRAADAAENSLTGLGPRLRESVAPRRNGPPRTPPGGTGSS